MLFSKRDGSAGSPRLVVVSVWAPDEMAAATFYRDVVGLELVSQTDSGFHFALSADGAVLAVLRGTPQVPAETESALLPLIAFSVPDLEAAIARLDADQVEMPWGVEAQGEARWVRFRDPAGNMLEFVQFD